MSRLRSTVLVLCLLALAACRPEPALTVMSFNVRLGVADDGENSWPQRRAAAAGMINDQHPAAFGVQEAFDFQLAWFQENCPDYQWVGVGREDGIHEGEHMSVFYDTLRVELKDWGTYWLSETPDVPSFGWDAACKRTATWTLLKDKEIGHCFYFVNTHLDHVGTEARKNGLLLLVERIGAMNPEGYPMILTGDMNVYPDDPCLMELRNLMDDARQTAAETDDGPTYHAWGAESGKPIDYVFYKGFSACDRFEVIRQSYGGVPYVSDHYPVKATLRY
ncbi:MAG: endonuclease/exonuclease/phosphatase family protein [Bacteroidales bacterium]|nr:endonuclease/exonuclease/phosphatase family protein [Bacteroidales bacterium]